MNFRKDLKKVATGIYKNTKTKKFFAEKRVEGKSYSRTFSNLHDAKKWRKSFENQTISFAVTQAKPQPTPAQEFSTLKEVWEAIRTHHFPILATSTKAIWMRRYRLLKDLEHLPMNEITPSKITSWVSHWVEAFNSENYKGLGRGNAGRCSLNTELNLIVTIFNWYKESEQFEK